MNGEKFKRTIFQTIKDDDEIKFLSSIGLDRESKSTLFPKEITKFGFDEHLIHLAIRFDRKWCLKAIRLTPAQTLKGILNSLDGEGLTPYEKSCKYASLETLKYLRGMYSNIDMEVSEYSTNSGFFEAILARNKEVVEFLSESLSLSANLTGNPDLLHYLFMKNNPVKFRFYMRNILDLRSTPSGSRKNLKEIIRESKDTVWKKISNRGKTILKKSSQVVI